MRKINYLFAFVLCFVLLLSGCALFDPLPDEFVDGIKLPRNYPDDSFEIYDDAIVYELKDDEDEISLTYGTEDDIDDIIDFYEDLLDDNDLTIQEQDDSKDEFYAKGYGEEFRFEITAEAPSGKYEERAFVTVVEVDIEFLEVGEINLEKLQGFWLMCGADGEISDIARMGGYAIEFKDNKMDYYENFAESTSDNDLSFIDNDTFSNIVDDDEVTFDIVFETIDDTDVVTLTSEGIELYFEKSSFDDMMSYQEMAIEETLKKLQGFWHYSGSEGVLSDGARLEGTAVEFDDMMLKIYIEFDSTPIELDFTFIDSDTISYELDGTEIILDLNFETIDDLAVLSTNNDGEVGNFESSSYEDMILYQDVSIVVPLDTDLSDSDLAYWVSGVSWTFVGYVYPDSSFEEASSLEKMTLYSDYTATVETDDGEVPCTWNVQDGYFYLIYSDGTTYSWPTDFEYDGKDAYLLLYDLEEGYEGGYWVYTVK